MESLRRELGPIIEPQSVHERSEGFVVTTFVLTNRRLVRREDVVALDGRLHRTEHLVASDLPVPSGRLWGMVNGRFVPIG